MRVDITSMFFNSKIINKTATPAWRTSLGQSANKECRIETDTPGVVDNLVGITYKAMSDLTKLDTKGTSGDILICSSFDKVFVNSIRVKGKYTMLVVRETSASHSGRMQLCYSPNYSYDSHRNVDTIDNMRLALGCSPQGCWFVYDISVKNQDELHFSAIVVDASNPVEYSGESQDRSKLWKELVDKEINQMISNLDIKEEFHRYLSEPTRFKSATTGELYWRTITSGRQEIAFLCELIKELFGYECDDIFVITKYEEAELLWNKTKEDDRNNFQNQICSAILGKYKEFLKERVPLVKQTGFNTKGSVQQILYGAPGTGKSNGLLKDEKNATRVTFHPDSDYASFVGCYKPHMKDGKIEYTFTPQPFLEAYIEAWNNPKEEFQLIIEEINRGNCAQIFGDIFQLLDRDKDGMSRYPIKIDTDMWEYLKIELPDDYCTFLTERYPKLNTAEQRMSLPPNLSIYATMNTSDQSLFPMDSAFKRRWNWKYIKIDYDEQNGDYQNWTLEGFSFKWRKIHEAINRMIKQEMRSTDKQFGQWFIRPDKDKTTISFESFRDKVLFYLFNDVYKDNDEFGTKFMTDEEKNDSGNIFLFESLFEKDIDGQKKAVEIFFKNINLKEGKKQEE